MQPQKTPILAIVALVTVQLIFGFNYAASKIILMTYPPLLWAAVRVAIAAVMMFAVAFVIVPREKRTVSVRFLATTFVFAVFGLVLMQAFFLYGLKFTTTSNSAILNSLTPIFTLAFAILLRREKLTWLRALGFLLAVTGVLVLKGVENFTLSFQTLKGDIYTLLSCASLAFFFVISRDFLKKHSPLWVTAWMFFFGVILLAAAAVPDFQSVQWSVPDGRLLFAMIYSIVGATMITYFLNSWTLTKVNASSVSLFIYLQPLIAVFNAWFSLNETPSLRTALAILLVFSGVGIGALKKA